MKHKHIFVSALSVFAAFITADAQVLTDFESFTAPGANGGIMFRTPNVSGSTSTKIEPNPSTLISQVRSVGIPSGNPNVGNNALFASWSFIDSGGAPLWLRFTTDNTDTSAPLFRPTITLAAGTGLQFDIWSDHAMYVSGLIRETESNAAFGAPGGATGSIEFLGGNPSAASGSRGIAVSANTWTTILLDFQNTPAFGFTGNGVLDAGVDGKGVLESLGLAFDDVSGNRIGDISIWVDNFAIVAVPEPSSVVLSLLGGGMMFGLIRKRRA